MLRPLSLPTALRHGRPRVPPPRGRADGRSRSHLIAIDDPATGWHAIRGSGASSQPFDLSDRSLRDIFR
jgi:hypothetical protein